MQNHIKLAAQVNIIFGWIGIGLSILAGISIFILFIASGGSLNDLTAGDTPGSWVRTLGLLLLVLGSLQLIFSITQLSGGRKLLAGEKGMTGLMIVSLISLLAFPIGTIIGAYTIWVISACRDLLIDLSTIKHPHAEQMAQEGIIYNGRYYAVGEIHFDKLDDAFAYARQLKQRNISV